MQSFSTDEQYQKCRKRKTKNPSAVQKITKGVSKIDSKKTNLRLEQVQEHPWQGLKAKPPPSHNQRTTHHHSQLSDYYHTGALPPPPPPPPPPWESPPSQQPPWTANREYYTLPCQNNRAISSPSSNRSS